MHALHVLHRPVTLLAGDAGQHMLAVIEIHEIRKIMYLDPRDGSLLLYSFLEFFDLDSLLFEQAMTVHADAGGAGFQRVGSFARHSGNRARVFG